jgi:hypothetical protein
MYWGVQAEEKTQDLQNNNLLLSKNNNRKIQQQKNSQQATVFLTKVSNVYVTSNSACVTRLPHTITRVQIVLHQAAT